MKQTNGTYEVKDGMLMADQDQCIGIANCRVIVEPLSQPAKQNATEFEKRADVILARMDRAATRLMKYFVIGTALYLLAEIVNAFASGAFAAAVK